jgi:catechol 2,3-dioxygenase-like lactoylglutathione lyase family enzyme
MSYLDVTHIAVNVPDLREAEAFYCDLFGLEVAWRDCEGAASPFATWDQLDAVQAQPAVIMLWRDVFKLALGAEPASRTSTGALSHIGLQVTPARLVSIRERVTILGLPCPALARR